MGGFDWHKKTGELGFNISSFQSIADVYSLDLKTGKVTHWAKTELNGFPTTGLREPELIKWKSFDGKDISGFIYKPPTTFKGKRPVIINIHGGPEGQARPGPLGRNSYYINDLGVAMIFPNVRGSTRFRQDISHARQRIQARGFGEGYRRAARLDRNAARPR